VRVLVEVHLHLIDGTIGTTFAFAANAKFGSADIVAVSPGFGVLGLFRR
jgi:hypothetical protein